MDKPSIKFTTQSRSPWSSVLRRWITTSEEYSKAWDWQDVHWWYRERASLGLFAAAMWKAGGTAIEEYQTPKRRESSNSRYDGRCDICLTMPQTDHAYIGEAKHVWSPLPSNGEKVSITAIKRSLADAFKDARRVCGDEKKFGVALVSLHLPFVKKNKRPNAKTVTDAICRWDEEVKGNLERLGAKFAAWVFPEKVRTISDGNKVVPGAAVFIRLKDYRASNLGILSD